MILGHSTTAFYDAAEYAGEGQELERNVRGWRSWSRSWGWLVQEGGRSQVEPTKQTDAYIQNFIASLSGRCAIVKLVCDRVGGSGSHRCAAWDSICRKCAVSSGVAQGEIVGCMSSLALLIALRGETELRRRQGTAVACGGHWAAQAGTTGQRGWAQLATCES